MNRVVVNTCALLFTLAAGQAAAQDPRAPNVSVSGNQIAVSPDPIRLDRSHVSNGRWQISWRLTDDVNFTFPGSGIEIEPSSADRQLPNDLRCNRQANGARFVCSFKPRNGTFSYKYTINVDRKSGGRLTLDPTVNTDF